MASHRYWRVVRLESYAGGPLELSEFHLLDGTTRVDASVTLTSNIAPTNGSLANLQDDDTATSAAWTSTKGLVLNWDFGVDTEVNGIRLGSVSGKTKFLLTVALQSSDDGVSWSARETYSGVSWPGVSELTQVIWNDASKWTARPSGTSANWAGVVFGNGLFVAVASNAVMTSPDGITWTPRTAAANNNWTSVVFGNGLFVAVSLTGTGNRVMTSPDGVTWTSQTSAADNSWVSIAFGAGLFVAVAMGTSTGQRVMTSSDGVTWTLRSPPVSSASWTSITYGAGLFVAVGTPGSSSNRVMTSPDGITWTLRSSVAASGWKSVTFGAGLFVAVANTTSSDDRIMTSPDGIDWTSRTGPSSATWHAVAFGYGVFVAVSGMLGEVAGNAMTSVDGITWTRQASLPSYPFSSVVFGEGLCVAIAGFTDGGSRAAVARVGYRIRTNTVEGRVAQVHTVLVLSDGAAAPYSGTKLVERLRALPNFLTGGTGRITGTVKEIGTPEVPVRRRVRLIRERDGLLVQEQWSDPITGAYDFQYVETDFAYTVLSYDHTGTFRAVVADRLEPEAMP